MALDLTREEQYALAAVAREPGYQVLLDVLEKHCQVRETELLRIDATQPDHAVLRKHAECRAGRSQFEELQREVQYHVSEVSNA